MSSDAAVDDLACEYLYRLLSIALTDPNGVACWDTMDAVSMPFAEQAAQVLRDEVGHRPLSLAFGELSPDHLDVRELITALTTPRDTIVEEHNRVFGLVTPRECPPYETEYHPCADAFFRSQQLADVAGFYRAFGLETADGRADRPDHVALELEFVAVLLMKKRLALQEETGDAVERARLCDGAHREFFKAHLAWWVPTFTIGLRRKACGGLYEVLARVLAALIAIQRERLDVPAPSSPARPTLIEQPEQQPGCAACALRS